MNPFIFLVSSPKNPTSFRVDEKLYEEKDVYETPVFFKSLAFNT